MTKTTEKSDPRILPVAHFLCELQNDEWSLGRKFWLSSSKQLLSIADKAK